MWDGEQENAAGREALLGEHLARTLFGKAAIGQSVEVAGVEIDFPWLTEDRGEVGFELGDLGFEFVAD